MDPVVKNVKRYYSCVDETCKVEGNHAHVKNNDGVEEVVNLYTGKNYIDFLDFEGKGTI